MMSVMLTLIASLLAIVGLVLLLVGGIAFIIAAFRESILWGLGVLFLPFVSLIFLVLNWSRAKQPFFLQLYGVAFLIGAAILSDNNLPWPLG